jgi:hypothetical protein
MGDVFRLRRGVRQLFPPTRSTKGAEEDGVSTNDKKIEILIEGAMDISGAEERKFSST